MKNTKRFLLLAVSAILILACAAVNPQAQQGNPNQPRPATPRDRVLERNPNQARPMTPRDRVVVPAEAPAPTDATQDEDKTFQKPRWKDQRLDWCVNWGTDCGQPAADLFCKRRRFTGAKDFRAEPDVGRSEPTRLAGSDQVCDQPFCTGFDYITCFGPLPQEQIFAPPVWRNSNLDWCLNWGTDCGKPAADAFCKAKGFSEALYFQSDSGIGRKPTRLIGADQICNEKSCVAFQIITCKR